MLRTNEFELDTKALRNQAHDINGETERFTVFIKVVGCPVNLAAHAEYRVRLPPGFFFCGQRQLIADRRTDCD